MKPSRAHGFSLLELLFVLVIVGVLVSVSLAGYASIAQATALTTGAAALSDLFTEAKQDAVTKNLSVEVRIYDVPLSTDSHSAYRALQLHWLNADGTTPGIAPPLYLPASMIMDATVQHSSLIAANSQTVPTDMSDPRLNRQTRVFHFLADGSTDLTPGEPWFVTLRAESASDPNHFPNDWACLTLDPTTGHVQTYRP